MMVNNSIATIVSLCAAAAVERTPWDRIKLNREMLFTPLFSPAYSIYDYGFYFKSGNIKMVSDSKGN
jgi:hypothetical protein